MENKQLHKEVTKKVIQAVRQGKNREVVQKITSKKIHVKADGYTKQNGGNRLYKHMVTVGDKTGHRHAEEFNDKDLERMYSKEIKHAYLKALYDEIELSVDPKTYKRVIEDVENVEYNSFLNYGIYVWLDGEIEFRTKNAEKTIALTPHDVEIKNDTITFSTRLGELKLTKEKEDEENKEA